MRQRPTNWAGNLTFHVEHVRRPSSLNQLRKLVSASDRMRVLGSGHSFNTIADTDGDLVSIADLPRTIDVDPDDASVTVSGGVRYGELSQHLYDAGYALHNLGSLPHISVAGSCATATHGSGHANGNLATAVTAIELVTSDGSILSLSSSDPRFDGVVVGLGALGIVVNMTLAIEPAFDVQQFVYDGLSHEAVYDHFDQIVSSAYSVSLFTRWREPQFEQVWVKHRVDHGTWPGSSPWFEARPADGPRHPLPGVSPVNCTEQMGVPGPWHERLPHFRLEFTPSNGEELQSEYFVPRPHAAEAIRSLHAIRDRIAPALQICEIRTVAADELWMSPSYRRDLVGFHFTWLKDPSAVLPVLPLIEECLAPFGVIPHWGKLFTMAPETLQSRYPRLGEFRELARSLDPGGTFRNDFVDRYVFG